MKRLSPGEKFTIQRFIHNWLPTGKRTHRNDIRICHKCPLCKKDQEDNIHMLQCRHRSVESRRKQLIETLRKHLADTKSAPIMRIIIPEAIRQWTEGETNECNSEARQGKALWEAQKELGWEQFIKGRVHYKFVDIQEAYQVVHNHQNQDGAQWMSRIIAIIWRWIHKTWMARNEILHGNTITEQQKIKRNRIIDRVRRCYKEQWKIPWKLRQRMKTEMEDKIREPTSELKAWLIAIEAAIKRATDNNDGQKRISAIFPRENTT